MKIETTTWYPYAPIKRAKVKNSDGTKCWQECRETGSLVHCWREHKIVQPV